jgi:HK97 family phage prohead protease
MQMKRYLLGEVKALESENPQGEFEVVLSMPTVDRDGEIIDAKAFEPLPESVPFHAFHDFTDPIGRGVPFYDGDVLKARGFYASTPRAQEIRALVSDGVIGHTSVGFMPPVREVKEGVPHVTKAELLEGSFVSVPANRDAAVLMAKSGARNSATDAGRLQQIHDLAVENGADCTTKDVHRHRVEVKTISGSWEERRDLLLEAIQTLHPDSWWTSIVATFDDEVVYRVETMDGTAEYRASYEIEDGVVTLEAGEPVEVTEVVAPKGADEPAVVDPEKAAAPAAAKSPADASAGMARLAALRAEAELLLLG